MIHATIVGNVTRDAEQKQVGGDTVAEFTVASNGSKKDAPATFVKCSIWGKRAAALAGHISKGTKLILSGTLTMREYLKKDGTSGSSLELRVNEVEFGGSKQTSGARHVEEHGSSEDIPF